MTLVAVAVAVVVFFLIIRPWYLKWGARYFDMSRPLPGDNLVPQPKMVSTRAILINASPEEIWPWLVQVGYGRAGWYNHDWINRILGVANYIDGHHSSVRIIPELQNLEVEDEVKMQPNGGWTVSELQKAEKLVFLARVDMKTWQTFTLSDKMPERYLNSSQSIVLEEDKPGVTRMIVRDRMDFNMGPMSIMNYILEPGFFIQESAFMQGIKKRAEISVKRG